MFEDSLIESGGRLKTKRGLTTTISVIFQIGLLMVMILIPLIFTEALPKQQLMTFLVATPPPPSPARFRQQWMASSTTACPIC